MSSSLFNGGGVEHATSQATAALDNHALDNLRGQAFGEDKEAALREAAKQFEAIFLNMVMGSMRKANDVFAKDNPLNSRYTNMYRDMYDQQLTSELSSQGSLGLADLMVQQLSQQGGLKVNERPGASLADPRAAITRAASQQLSDQGGRDAGLFYGDKRVNQLKVSDQTTQITSPEDFINTLRPHAEKVAAETGISAKALIAQAALETGWGQRIVPGRHGGSSNNLFNIKADQRWGGDKSHVNTLEFNGQVAEKQRAAFRSYQNLEQSLHDYASFINQHPRYQQAVAVAEQPEHYAEQLQQAGYATDPHYADKLKSILKRL
ncbi:flagellar assembly peptidoglycan hydrolase FlgJ [Idiomarina seosinensis]|uniref:flagellar assembly peptidoglycan hydrolase FlgJ n=1 Tax=Idiomarina seosinensis TaxID=281739 RepID=UPI00384ED3D8